MIESYDLLVHKEIVRRLREGGYQVTDGQSSKTSPIIVIYESEELSDDTKTFKRNVLRYTIKVWGSCNGSSLEIKTLKQEIVKLLMNGDYVIEGIEVEQVKLSNTIIFKELEGQGSANHYFQCILHMEYLIKED